MKRSLSLVAAFLPPVSPVSCCAAAYVCFSSPSLARSASFAACSAIRPCSIPILFLAVAFSLLWFVFTDSVTLPVRRGRFAEGRGGNPCFGARNALGNPHIYMLMRMVTNPALRAVQVEIYTGPSGITYVDTPGLEAPEYSEHRATTCKKVKGGHGRVGCQCNPSHERQPHQPAQRDAGPPRKLGRGRELLASPRAAPGSSRGVPQPHPRDFERYVTFKEKAPVVQVVYLDAYAAERHFVDSTKDLDADTAAAFTDLRKRTAPVYQQLQWLRGEIAALRRQESQPQDEIREVEDRDLGALANGVRVVMFGAAAGALAGPVGALAGPVGTLASLVLLLAPRWVRSNSVRLRGPARPAQTNEGRTREPPGQNHEPGEPSG